MKQVNVLLCVKRNKEWGCIYSRQRNYGAEACTLYVTGLLGLKYATVRARYSTNFVGGGGGHLGQKRGF